MAMTTLKNADGSLKGFIHQLSNHRIEIRTANGEPLGWYNPSNNITYQINGSMVGFGDLLTSLL